MTITKEFVYKHMQGKNILYVPIVSSINRQTNKYNLDSDGNVVRFITFFEHHNEYHHLTVILPTNNESHHIVDSWANDNDIDIVWSENFGKHAGEQRSDPEVVHFMELELRTLIEEQSSKDQFDIIIFESQYLGESIVSEYWFEELEKVFWCPVCKIDNEHTRNFLEGYDELNKKLFRESDWSIVESPTQLKKFSLLNTKIYPYYKMVDRSLPYFGYVTELGWKDTMNIVSNMDASVYYLPYRLTDEGYKINDVISYINIDYAKNILVYYTDPNNSGYMDIIKNKFNCNVHCIKISGDRNSHFSMLSCSNVIVPYFEDLDFINHALLWEMMSNKSRCQFAITKEQWDENPYDVKSCDRCFYIDIDKF